MAAAITVASAAGGSSRRITPGLARDTVYCPRRPDFTEVAGGLMFRSRGVTGARGLSRMAAASGGPLRLLEKSGMPRGLLRFILGSVKVSASGRFTAIATGCALWRVSDLSAPTAYSQGSAPSCVK